MAVLLPNTVTHAMAALPPAQRRRRAQREAFRHVTAVCVALTCALLVLSSLLGGRTASSSAVPPPPPPAPALSPEACVALARSWVAQARGVEARRGAVPRLNLTFFLHVPRTAGRTLFFCGLKPAFAPSERCLRSYDQLRVQDMSQPGCALLSSHDDHRLVDALPGNATVVTQLRRPQDRVVSAYEFAVEVAARTVFGRKRPAEAKVSGKTATIDVWPWSALVPMLRADMEDRRRARGWRAPSRFGAGPISGYSSPFVMSLSDFVRHPLVADVVHNGATFQLLGLTANGRSFAPGAREDDAEKGAAVQAAQLRACVSAPGPAAEVLLGYAQARLTGHIAAVTLTDRLNDSIALLAASLGRPLSGQGYRTIGDRQEQEDRQRVEKHPDAAAAVDADAARKGGSLAHMYRKCVVKQSNRTATRRRQALGLMQYADGFPFDFHRPDVTLPYLDQAVQTIRAANHLDAALYALGERLFDQRREVRASGCRCCRGMPPDPHCVIPSSYAGAGAASCRPVGAPGRRRRRGGGRVMTRNSRPLVSRLRHASARPARLRPSRVRPTSAARRVARVRGRRRPWAGKGGSRCVGGAGCAARGCPLRPEPAHAGHLRVPASVRGANRVGGGRLAGTGRAGCS